MYKFINQFFYLLSSFYPGKFCSESASWEYTQDGKQVFAGHHADTCSDSHKHWLWSNLVMYGMFLGGGNPDSQ